jgi:hypothetical protein
MAYVEGDRVVVYLHDEPTKKLGKGTVTESPAYHFNHQLKRYIRVQITHPMVRSIPKGVEVMVATRFCKKLVPKVVDEPSTEA